MTVQGEQATVKRGDGSYAETLTGIVGADMKLSLQGRGAMTRTPDQPWSTQASGSFALSGADARFEAFATLADVRGATMRNCKLEMVKVAG
jgi:hypothetical protein